MLKKSVYLMCDGGSRGNPGPSAAGAVLFDSDKKEIIRRDLFLGTQTNNFAEYSGLILGLESALLEQATDIEVFMDSQLVVEQVQGKWKLKSLDLKPLHARSQELAKKFAKISFTYISRAKNKVADGLVNACLDHWQKNK